MFGKYYRRILGDDFSEEEIEEAIKDAKALLSGKGKLIFSLYLEGVLDLEDLDPDLLSEVEKLIAKSLRDLTKRRQQK